MLLFIYIYVIFQGKYNHLKINKIKKDYNDFKIRYENWKEKIQNNIKLSK